MRRYLLDFRKRDAARGTFKMASTVCVSSTAVPGGCSGEKRLAARVERRLPEALSEDQVRRLLGGIRNPIHKTCLAASMRAVCG